MKPQNPDEAPFEPTAVALPTAEDYERGIKKTMFSDQLADNDEDSEMGTFEWLGSFLKMRSLSRSSAERIVNVNAVFLNYCLFI